MDISYLEKSDKLADRIRAHKLFANFDVSDWVAEFLERNTFSGILDLGCGDGNHIGSFLQHVGPRGRVAGLDRGSGLIEQVRRRYGDDPRLELAVASMDERLPFADGSFDLCASIFAVYNAADAAFTMGELRRVMADGGRLVLVGPAAGNAVELNDFAEKACGRRFDDKVQRRGERILTEFVPIAVGLFDDVQVIRLRSVLTFPDAAEFLRYFAATELCEQTVEAAGVPVAGLLELCEPGMTVSKEMIAVVAR